MPSFTQKLRKTFLAPIQAFKAKYIPLLLIYFAYGSQGVMSILLLYWEKDNLTLSTTELIAISAWLAVPFTLKMIIGQLVDTKPIFGSRRKAYIYLGAFFMVLGYATLYGLMAESPWIAWMGGEFNAYLTYGLLTTTGFMIQDVTADTMSVEVVEHTQEKDGQIIERPDKEIKTEVAMVQILGRLALLLGTVITAFYKDELAKAFEFMPEKIVFVALGIPLISIAGAAFIRLEKTQETKKEPFNHVIMIGGILYGLFVLLMAFWNSLISWLQLGGISLLQGISQYNQEITFVVSLFLLSFLVYWMVREIAPEKRKIIYYSLAAIFIFRLTPGTGPGFSWWAIDILKLDQDFFGVIARISAIVPFVLLWLCSDYIASKPVRSVFLFLIFVGTILSLPELGLYYGVHETLGLNHRTVLIADTVWDSPLVHISMIPTLALIAYFAPAKARGTWFAVGSSLMNLALMGSALGTKYLNRTFPVSREIVEKGIITTPQDYSLLGELMLWKIGLSFIIALLAVWYFLHPRRVGKV